MPKHVVDDYDSLVPPGFTLIETYDALDDFTRFVMHRLSAKSVIAILINSLRKILVDKATSAVVTQEQRVSVLDREHRDYQSSAYNIPGEDTESFDIWSPEPNEEAFSSQPKSSKRRLTR